MEKSNLKHNSSQKLSTIIFVDIVGYTKLMHDDESKALNTLKQFSGILGKEVKLFGGEIIQYYGDGCLISFDSTFSGINCVIEVQKQFIALDIPVRIGVHLGEVTFKDKNVFGDGVNIASRIESFGIPGSILISKTVQHQIKNKNSIQFQSVGFFNFKNISEAMEIFAISNDGIIIPKSKDMKGKGERHHSKTKILISSISIFLILALITFYMFVFQNNGGHSFGKTIAVIPLSNLNNDAELNYFSTGLSQEIIDELAKVESLRVSAFTQSSYYIGENINPQMIAEELEVNYLLSGTLRILDDTNKIKLSIELFNPHTKERIWSNTFERTLEKVPTIQIEIAKNVADGLDIALSEKETNLLSNTSTTNGEAFKLLLKAKSEIDQLSPNSLLRSQELLRQAIKLDSSYSQAYTLLAWSLNLSADPTISPNTLSYDEVISETEPLIKKSLSLNPNNSDAYIVRAALNLFNKNKVEDARKDVEKAIELKSWPKVPTNFCTCTITTTYVTLKDIEKAKDAIQLSMKIDPGNAFLSWDKGNVNMLEGDFLNAQKNYREALEKINNPIFNTYLGWSYYHSGEYENALKYLKIANKIDSIPLAMNIAYLSNTYFQIGDNSKSDYYLNKLIERLNSGEHHLNLYLSAIYSERKNLSKAIDYLEKSYKKNEHSLALFTSIDPTFNKLAENNRFISIRNKMQFKID